MEDNRLIAEFMGLGIQLHMVESPINGEYIDLDELEYSTSWDWLMPVVQKIKNDWDREWLSSLNDDECVEGMMLEHQLDMSFKCDYVSIENTYKYVLKFIKWHNKNK